MSEVRRRVRVGVDAAISDALLRGFPAEAEIVRLPSEVSVDNTATYEVDFWIPPFFASVAKRVYPQLRAVKVVQALMAGVDWLMWLPKDVTLCDGRTIHNISTSEWVLSAVLAMVKRLPQYRDNQMESHWNGQVAWAGGETAGVKSKPPTLLVLGDELHGKRVLIVGYGAIGAAIEDRLAPFGVEVTRVARSARNGVHAVSELDTLLPDAEIVILILPMTPETRGLMDARRIGLLRDGALLVNAARGPVVDTLALVAALNAGKISAAVDVTDPEPLPPEHPLWQAKNCLITPHVAASTTGLLPRAFAFAATQVERMVKGEPLENIVGDAGY